MIYPHRAAILILAILGFISGPASPSAAAPNRENETVARIHWLGLGRITSDTNSTQFFKVWHLPETQALLAQTLDKLSRLPSAGATNDASARLRPLLNDLVSSEFYLDIFTSSNHPSSFIHRSLFLAVRLPADRARDWQDNLGAALQPRRVEVARSGDWLLVGLGLDTGLKKFRVPAATTNWLETDFSPSRLFTSLSAGSKGGDVGNPSSIFHLPSSLTNVSLTLSAGSNDLLTHAILDFSSPLDLGSLPAWEIPTNLIHGPLTSFTAVRGIAHWLAEQPAWQKLQLNPPPDQAYFWAQAGIPFQTYLAAPMPAASNQLAQLAPRLVQDGNLWLDANAEGSFSWSDTLPGILWNDANIISPFIVQTECDHHDYLLGGFYPPQGGAATALPTRTLDSLFHRPDLIYFQSQGTGNRVEDGFFITQLFRLVFHKPQMTSTAAGTLWLKKAELLLGESSTIINRSGPRRLVLERTSTIGFSALELHLLADWLESPQFPTGFHTFLAPPDK